MRAARHKELIFPHDTISSKSKEVVKGEFSFRLQNLQNPENEAKNAKNNDISRSFAKPPFLTKDLIKSLVLAVLILSLELVIYWAR
ncbi:MAG: hypothetical protein HYW33_04235 [Candidatus Blackburnbacteria bacterium]|nr:hypothetical protein [Candidatus Blackburnbacteria bacterium]